MLAGVERNDPDPVRAADGHEGRLGTPLHPLEDRAGGESLGRAAIDREHKVVWLETGRRRHPVGRRRGDPPAVTRPCRPSAVTVAVGHC